MVVAHNREIKFHCKMSMIDLALTETDCRRVSWTHKHLGSSPESRSSAEVWTRGNPLVLQRSAEKLRNSWAIIETCEKLQMNARLGQEMRRQNVVDSTANHSSYCAHRRALLWLPSWLAQQLYYCWWTTSVTADTADEQCLVQQKLLMNKVLHTKNCWWTIFGTAETADEQCLAQLKMLMDNVWHIRNCRRTMFDTAATAGEKCLANQLLPYRATAAVVWKQNRITRILTTVLSATAQKLLMGVGHFTPYIKTERQTNSWVKGRCSIHPWEPRARPWPLSPVYDGYQYYCALTPQTLPNTQQQTIAAHLTFRGDIFRSRRYTLTFRLVLSCATSRATLRMRNTQIIHYSLPISISPQIEFYRQVIVALRIEISLFVVMILFSWDFTFTKLFVNFHLNFWFVMRDNFFFND